VGETTALGKAGSGIEDMLKTRMKEKVGEDKDMETLIAVVAVQKAQSTVRREKVREAIAKEERTKVPEALHPGVLGTAMSRCGGIRTIHSCRMPRSTLKSRLYRRRPRLWCLVVMDEEPARLTVRAVHTPSSRSPF